MPLYDFRCPVCGVFEALASRAETEVECACGQQATRLSVYRFNLGGGIGPKYRVTDFREAAQESNYYHGRMEESKGEQIPRIDAVAEAKQQARKRGAKVK